MSLLCSLPLPEEDLPASNESGGKKPCIACCRYVITADLYCNVHSILHPTGLLRGQVNALALQRYLAANLPPLAPYISPATPG